MKKLLLILSIFVVIPSCVQADLGVRGRDAISSRSSNATAYNVYLLYNSQAEAEIEKFDKILQKKEGYGIEQCRRVIEMPVGVKNGNVSYGAVCRGKGEAMLWFFICRDEMVGREVYQPVANVDLVDTLDLIKFVATECYGG